MESHDNYPVFHTRLTRTMRRRLTWPDGTFAGWLIATGDHFTEVPDDLPSPAAADDGSAPVTVPHQR